MANPTRPKAPTESIRRLLTVCGALLIFLTFVVKEAWRDRLKDSLDDISSAQTSFATRREARNLSQQVSAAMSVTVAVEDEVLAGKHAAAPADQTAAFNHKLALSGLHIEDDQLAVIAIEELNQAVPDRDSTAKLNALIPKLQNLGETYNQLAKQGTVPLPRPVKDMEADLISFSHQEADLSDELYGLGAALYKEGIDLEEKRQARYDFWTKISYGLYALGWGLTLIGRVYKVEALEIGE